MRKFILLLSAVLMLVALVGTHGFQDEVIALTPSPSPAPSKTPTPIPDAQQVEVTATVEVESNLEEAGRGNESVDRFEITEPYTQGDLKVLTGNVQRPNGIQWHNNNLYTACNGDWTLYEIGSESGDTITYSYGVKNAHAMYVEDISDSLIEIWVPDYEANALVKVSGQRSPSTVIEEMDGPWGIAYVDEEHFLVTALLGNEVLQVSREGDTEVLLSGLRSPTGITMNDDRVYIANNGSARRSIEWVDSEALLDGEEVETQSLVSGLQSTTGMVLADDKMLYFAYSLGTRGVVGRVDPEMCIENGGCTNDEVELVLYTELAAPLAGLSISPDMRLFVHTIYRPEIYWVDLDGNDRSMEQNQ